MASIRERSGKLVVDFRYRNQRCREKTVLDATPVNRKKLEKLLQKMEAEITLGTFDYAAYFPKSRRAEEFAKIDEQFHKAKSNYPSFSDFAKTWFAEKQIEWRLSYRRKVRTTLKKYLMPYFGEQPVDQVTRSELLAFRASLAKVKTGKDQKPLTASRINQIMIPARILLQEAADRYEFDSPYRNIKNLKETKPHVMPFTLEEIERFLKAVRYDFRNYYTVRFFTGLRTSEVDGLKWKNIDLNRREIHVRAALVDGRTEGTKTQGSTRVVQISTRVMEALKLQKALTGEYSDYVFCDRNGNPLDYRNVNRRVWHPTLKLLGLEPRRAYETRHTAATLWLASGENPEWIARQLGHSNTEMLFRVYSHYVPDLTRKDGSAFEALLSQSAAELEVLDEK
jgi:integrase